MYNQAKVAVVIPAFNEEELVKATILTLPDYVDGIIVVDDASTDATASVVEGLGVDNLVLIRHNTNGGVGKSILSGYKEALQSDYDVIVVMAADNQMCPLDLESVIEPVLSGRADYCKGNRFLDPGFYLRMPLLRIFGNFWFSVLSCIATGYYSVFDTQCGYTAVSRAVLEVIDLDSVYPRYGFPTDMLAKLSEVGARVVDVPVKAVYGREVSGIRPVGYTVNLLRLCIGIFTVRLYKYFRGKIDKDHDVVELLPVE